MLMSSIGATMHAEILLGFIAFVAVMAVICILFANDDE